MKITESQLRRVIRKAILMELAPAAKKYDGMPRKIDGKYSLKKFIPIELPYDHPERDEIAQDIGKTIMYAADLIIKSQKEWGTKHILEKLDDVLNDWGLVTEFVEVLMELNIIQSATEVIDFYKNPTMYEKEFLLWEEYDYPYSDDEAWHDFKKVVLLSQHGDTL